MDRIAFIIGETFIFWSPIILALGALTAVLWFLGLYIGRSGNGLGGFLAVPMTFMLSMVLSRFIHWYCRTDSYTSLEAAMTDYTSGSYALAGVFIACIAVAVFLRLIRVVRDLPEMLDCMALGGSVGIGIGRLYSLFNSTDRGDILESITELPLAYPVANSVTGEMEYRLATFMLQALACWAIFAVLLLFWLCMKRAGKSGDTCLLFLLLYGASQIVLDSTRYDSLFLRSNGFVSLVQIAAAVAMVFALVMFSVRLIRSLRFRFWYLAFWLPILGLLGGAGYMEYYVQRHGNEALFAYTVMSGCLIGVIVIGIAMYTIAVIAENVNKRKAARAAAALEAVTAEEPAETAEEPAEQVALE